MSKPIFEIRYNNSDTHYKIYEDGRTEGFGQGAIIVNRIAGRIAEIQGNASLSDSCPSKNLTSDESGCEQATPL